MNILQEILNAKRIEIADKATLTPLEHFQHLADDLPKPPLFSKAFLGKKMGIIAEVKHRSPSAGVIRDPFEPAQIAKAYKAGGAGAVSVLMDEAYFGGGEDHFREVRAAVDLPLLYKEFVIDPWQIWHARSLGASAVLLIAAALSDEELKDFSEIAAKAKLEVLLEVHDQEELDRALALQAPIIGINNRDLKTFHTTLETTLGLAKQIPANTILISESGIRTAEDMKKLIKAGARGVLVGEHLLRHLDVEEAVRLLRG
jgi:indole-3-glycerol phosphate synthase